MPPGDPTLDTTLRPHADRLAAQREFVRALARRLVAPNAVDDLAQDVLVAGLHHPPREPSALRGWLAAATRNLASKWRRGEERRRRREQAVARPEALPSTRELVERIELEQELVRAVLQLREPERTTLLLRFHEGLAPAEIAARVGLPADTVRARLRRGLERLRGQLDAKYGTRGWVGWLLPIAGVKSLAEAAAIGSAAGAGGAGSLGGAGAAGSGSTVAAGVVTAGVTLMAAKIWIAGAAATVAVVVGIGHGSRWLPPLLGGAPRPEFAGAADGAPLAAAVDGTAPLAPLAPPAERLEAAPDGAADDAAAAAAALPPPGQVTLRLVDRTTGAVVGDGVHVRFLAEKRFAEHDGGGEIEVQLSGGRWTARVHARGFEPYDLGAFTVDAAVPLDLGTIELQAGSGVIEGDVLARHLAAEQPVRVELRGHGMRRCAACAAPQEEAPADAPPPAEPTHACGSGDDPSWHQLTGARRFRFEGLAQGTYQLRAFDPQQQIVDAARIDVHRGGYRWVPLEVSAPTTALLELRHARGGRFHGDWAAIHAETTAPIEFTVERDGKSIAHGSWQPSADEVREAQGGPLVPLPEHAEAEAPLATISHASLFTGQLVQLGQMRFSEVMEKAVASQVRFVIGDDQALSVSFTRGLFQLVHPNARERERGSDDSLEWVGAPTDPEPAALAVRKLRPDAFRLEPLPRALLTVRVKSGGYESEPFPLDLRFGEGLPGVVSLPPTVQRLEEFEWSRQAPPASCTACHAARSVDGKTTLDGWTRKALGDYVTDGAAAPDGAAPRTRYVQEEGDLASDDSER